MITEAYARAFAEFLESLLLDMPGYESAEIPLKEPGFVVRNAIGEGFLVTVQHLDVGEVRDVG